MQRLSVYFIDPAGAVHNAGALAIDDSSRRLRIQFKYTEAFLSDRNLPALDPVSLKKKSTVYEFDYLPYVFDDCLPGAWGKRWLIRANALPRSQQHPHHLLRFVDSSALGGLFFSTDPAPEHQSLTNKQHRQEQGIATEQTAIRMAESILKFDEEGELELQDGVPIQPAHSSGGMRPKFTAHLGGKHRLLKLGLKQDKQDLVRLEHSCMSLAKACGLNVANTEVITLGDREALSVERFDINETGGRHHKISMKTLLKADEHFVGAYHDMAKLILRYSAEPKVDVAMFYRQMLFNVLINNTDDHLRNFEMHIKEEGWRLTPAFDLVPGDPANLYFATRFGLNEYVEDWNALFKLHKPFTISPREAQNIRDEVLTGATQLDGILTRAAINHRDHTWLNQVVARQARYLKSSD